MLKSAALAAAAGQAGKAAKTENAMIELRYFYLRNNADNMRQRVSDFLAKHWIPANQRAGVGPMGFFGNLIAPGGPFVLAVRSYPSLYAMEQAWDKVGADKEYQNAVTAFQGQPGISYVRMETQLLRAFDSIPKIEVPPSEPKRPARVFELRTYESNNYGALRKKIGMFNNGEIAIFRKTGLLPIFFGETVFGPNMPNLVYMVAFDDLAAREKNWRTFVNDPDWQKLRATPGLSDAEVVSNISNVMLSPLGFSPIR